MKIETNERKEALQSAEPLTAEYAPVLRVSLAVCYMGMLSGVVAVFASILGIVSGRNAGDRLYLSITALLLFGAAAGVLSLVDSRKRRAYEEKRAALRDSAEHFKGRVTACEKTKHTVRYANEDFDEITWKFIVEYENENGDTVTVKTGRYLNDISNILADRSVDIYKTKDGGLLFENFSLTEDGIALEVREVGEDEP